MYISASTKQKEVVAVLGWSISLKRGDEELLDAESRDIGLDQAIHENASEVIQEGGGYPNRYLIRNDQLPKVELYRYGVESAPGVMKLHRIRYEFELEPFPDIPGDEMLVAELWDKD